MNKFIEQTALDYDLPYSVVKTTYDQWYDLGKFYDKLEEILKYRADSGIK